MSQIHMTHGNLAIMTGWDQPLQTVFLSVTRHVDEQEQDVFHSMFEHGRFTKNQAIAKLASLGVEPPAKLIDLLEDHQARNAGNEVVDLGEI